MSEQFNTRKITINDLLDNSQYNSHKDWNILIINTFLYLNLKYFIYIYYFKFMYSKLIELCLIEINKLNINIYRNRY